MVTVDVGRNTLAGNQLASLKIAGNTLFDERFVSPDRFVGWIARYEDWQAKVQSWLSRNLSVSIVFRFRDADQEGPMIHYRPVSCGNHQRHLNALRAKLMYLGSI